MTNYEKIKAMSVEEMVEFICKHTDCYYCPICDAQKLDRRCKDFLKEWLLQEAEE